MTSSKQSVKIRIPRIYGFLKAHPITAFTLVAFLLFIILFDWNWFRRPLESYISKKTHRTFRISDLHVKLGLTPTIQVQDLVFGNAEWGKSEPMASVKRLEFSVSIRDCLTAKFSCRAWH